MRKGREPSALSRRLEALGVGDYDIIGGVGIDRVRATIQGVSTRMNTLYPERRFELFNLGAWTPVKRTKVRRLEDIAGQDWAMVWAEAMAADAAIGGGGISAATPAWTYVPGTHGFAQWAEGEGLGVLGRGWWAWEHDKGWKAQKAAQKVLRRHGVAARTWK